MKVYRRQYDATRQLFTLNETQFTVSSEVVQRIVRDPFGSISSVRHTRDQSTHSVVVASRGTEELERPASFNSPVWERFGSL